jgi:hypothetical protein
MTKPKTPAAPPLLLHCTFRDAARDTYGDMTKYAHFEAEAFILAPERFGPDKNMLRLRDPDDAEFGSPLRELSGFQVTAQIDDVSPDFYGLHIGFRPRYGGLADLDQARRFVRVLGRVDRARTRLEDQVGRAQDIPQTMAYLARGLGIKDAHPFTCPLDGRDDINGIGARYLDTDQLRWWLTGQVKEWRKRYGLTLPPPG